MHRSGLVCRSSPQQNRRWHLSMAGITAHVRMVQKRLQLAAAGRRVVGMPRWCSVLSKSHLMILIKGRTVGAPNSERDAAQITNLHLELPPCGCCQSGELLTFNLLADRCYLPG